MHASKREWKNYNKINDIRKRVFLGLKEDKREFRFRKDSSSSSSREKTSFRSRMTGDTFES